MKNICKYLLVGVVSTLLMSSCGDDIDPNWPGPNYQQNLKIKPLSANNNIVAHRGGATEAGVPDNSIASLEYAMGLRCYAVKGYICQFNSIWQGNVVGVWPLKK